MPGLSRRRATGCRVQGLADARGIRGGVLGACFVDQRARIHTIARDINPPAGGLPEQRRVLRQTNIGPASASQLPGGRRYRRRDARAGSAQNVDAVISQVSVWFAVLRQTRAALGHQIRWRDPVPEPSETDAIARTTWTSGSVTGGSRLLSQTPYRHETTSALVGFLLPVQP